MSLWVDTRGRSTAAIGLCDRCHKKMSLDELMPDTNYPGLRVCAADRDQLDPYRLPARQPERIALRFPRPDVDITQVHNNIVINGVTQIPIATDKPVQDPVTGNINDLRPQQG